MRHLQKGRKRKEKKTGSEKSYKHWTELVEKEPLALQYIAANPSPHNCTLPANYMRLLASHENKHPQNMHPSKINTSW